MSEIESLCDDGDLLEQLTRRFRERVAKGMVFGDVLAHLERALKVLDDKMSLRADVMGAVTQGERKQ